jgi:hypothetical protein
MTADKNKNKQTNKKSKKVDPFTTQVLHHAL